MLRISFTSGLTYVSVLEEGSSAQIGTATRYADRAPLQGGMDLHFVVHWWGGTRKKLLSTFRTDFGCFHTSTQFAFLFIEERPTAVRVTPGIYQLTSTTPSQ